MCPFQARMITPKVRPIFVQICLGDMENSIKFLHAPLKGTEGLGGNEEKNDVIATINVCKICI